MAKQNNTKTTISSEAAWKLFNSKHFESALESFNNILASGYDHDASYGKSCSLFMMTDIEGALAELSMLINKDAKNEKYLHTRAMFYGANEQYNEALTDLNTILDINPGNCEVLCDLGGLYLVMNDYINARICFERSVDIDKSFSCAWFGKGMVALSLKEYKKAGEYFNIVIKLDSKHRLAYMARAETAFSSGRKKEALKDVIKALSLDKDFFAELREMLPLSETETELPDEKVDLGKKTLDDEDAMEVY